MRVIALEKGARGVVKIGLDSGSLFSFRLAYLQRKDPPEENGRGEEPGGSDENAGLLSLLDSAFASGKEIELPAWERALPAIERAHALYAIEKKALSMLARREHSRTELAKKLAKMDFSAVDCRIVLGRLEEEGLLSDERFAEAWLRSRIRLHPEGEFGLGAGLRAKGVEKGIIKEKIDSERGEILKGLAKLALRIFRAEQRKAERKAGEKPDRREILKRCYAKLRSRGYSHADAKKAVSEVSGSPVSIDEADEST